MTPEEKLLRAIFGEKASDVRDTSLKLPPGVAGTIVDVRVFNRRGVDKDERALAIERAEIERLAKDRDDERAIQERSFLTVCGRRCSARLPVRFQGHQGRYGNHLRGAGRASARRLAQCRGAGRCGDGEHRNPQAGVRSAVKRLQDRFESKVEKLQRGDELLPGVMKMVKVFVAVKRKLQPGDKMAGRHGNKGVVSRVVPVEDMPFLEDGTPVDLVLNPSACQPR